MNSLIPSRTVIQVRSHAQKFYQKMKLCKDENLGIDFTLKSINNIKNIINQIKSKYPNYNNIYIFKKLLNDCVKRRFLKKKKKNKRYKIDNNLPKNEDKNELIKFDEINNNLINNLTFNQNNQNNKYMKSLENNNINQTINTKCNFNLEPKNNIEFKNILDKNIFNNNFELKNNIGFKNIIDNNFFNNNCNILPNILNNSSNLDSTNDILSSSILDILNGNNNLSDFLCKNLIIDKYITYLSLINDLLSERIKILNIINSIDNIFLMTILKDLDFLNNNPLINSNNTLKNNNNNLFINTNNPLINNNNLQIDNNNPLMINGNLQRDNNMPLIKKELPNNKKKEN